MKDDIKRKILSFEELDALEMQDPDYDNKQIQRLKEWKEWFKKEQEEIKNLTHEEIIVRHIKRLGGIK